MSPLFCAACGKQVSNWPGSVKWGPKFGVSGNVPYHPGCVEVCRDEFRQTMFVRSTGAFPGLACCPRCSAWVKVFAERSTKCRSCGQRVRLGTPLIRPEVPDPDTMRRKEALASKPAQPSHRPEVKCPFCAETEKVAEIRSHEEYVMFRGAICTYKYGKTKCETCYRKVGIKGGQTEPGSGWHTHYCQACFSCFTPEVPKKIDGQITIENPSKLSSPKINMDEFSKHLLKLGTKFCRSEETRNENND